MEGRAIARPNITRNLFTFIQTMLQWRAGQLPGQTEQAFNAAFHVVFASMEGRAIARPNWITRPRNLPARLELQWRAGQLPGQTV